MTSEHKKATKCLVFSFTYQRSYSSSIGEWRAIAAWMKIIHVLKRKDEKVLVSMLFLPAEKGAESTYRGYQEGLIDALIVLLMWTLTNDSKMCVCVSRQQRTAASYLG